MTDSLKIKTDNKWRNFVYRYDVPAKVLADQFDYLSEDDSLDGFFRYRNYWYHTSDFMRCSGMPDLKDWHGYSSDSAFSGILIRMSKDGEQFQVATYYS